MPGNWIDSSLWSLKYARSKKKLWEILKLIFSFKFFSVKQDSNLVLSDQFWETDLLSQTGMFELLQYIAFFEHTVIHCPHWLHFVWSITAFPSKPNSTASTGQTWIQREQELQEDESTWYWKLTAFSHPQNIKNRRKIGIMILIIFFIWISWSHRKCRILHKFHIWCISPDR